MIDVNQFCTRLPITIQKAVVNPTENCSELWAQDASGDKVILGGLDGQKYFATYVQPGQRPPASHQVGGREAGYLLNALTWDGLPANNPQYADFNIIARDLMNISLNQP